MSLQIKNHDQSRILIVHISQTYHEYPDRQISAMKQPKRPTRKPAITLSESDRDYSIVQNILENRPVIALLDDPCQGNSQLKIV